MALPSSLWQVPGYHGFNIPHPAPEPVLLMALESSSEKSSAIFLSTRYVSIPLFSLLPSRRTPLPAAAQVFLTCASSKGSSLAFLRALPAGCCIPLSVERWAEISPSPAGRSRRARPALG